MNCSPGLLQILFSGFVCLVTTAVDADDLEAASTELIEEAVESCCDEIAVLLIGAAEHLIEASDLLTDSAKALKQADEAFAKAAY